MPIRDASADKAAAQDGTTRLPEQDDPTLAAILPPGDERDRQELERAAADAGGLGADGAKADKHQEALDRLTQRVTDLENQMLDKQHAAEDRAEPQTDPTQPKPYPAAALDQGLVAKVAKAAGLLPNQVFDMATRADGYRVITVDARKLDVKKGDVK